MVLTGTLTPERVAAAVRPQDIRFALDPVSVASAAKQERPRER